MKTTDVLIIGSGIAGATAALRLARNPNRRIVLLTRAPDPRESNSRYAQGGIIGRGPDDSADLLVKDILAAGAGASLPRAAEILAEEGPGLLQEILVETAGIHFDHKSDGDPEYGQEAAHSRRRILHVGDGTGRAIMQGLVEALKRMPNVEMETNFTAVDLITYPHHSRDPLSAYDPITCHGVYVFDRAAHTIHRTLAAATILATGGLGRIYRNTTNPIGARGDGLAMASRAGARITNCRIHPVPSHRPGSSGSRRVSSSARQCAAKEPYCSRPKASLSWRNIRRNGRTWLPRDVVARAIHTEMEDHNYSYVLLDIASHMPAAKIRERFPNIYAECKRVGVDITRESIPVVPAAHYFCGGVAVDEWGRSSIQNLYAIGEVSCTGLHGANRLASTSLLEGLVWGNRAALDVESRLSSGTLGLHPSPPGSSPLGRVRPDRGFRSGPYPGRYADHPEYHVALRGTDPQQ